MRQIRMRANELRQANPQDVPLMEQSDWHATIDFDCAQQFLDIGNWRVLVNVRVKFSSKNMNYGLIFKEEKLY